MKRTWEFDLLVEVVDVEDGALAVVVLPCVCLTVCHLLVPCWWLRVG